jgi:hypothetical protein
MGTITQPARRRVCPCDRALIEGRSFQRHSTRYTSLSNAVPDAVPYVLYAAPDAAPCVLYAVADAAPSQRSGPQRLIPLIAWRALPGRTPPPVQIEKESFDETLLPTRHYFRFHSFTHAKTPGLDGNPFPRTTLALHARFESRSGMVVSRHDARFIERLATSAGCRKKGPISAGRRDLPDRRGS